MKFNFWNKKEQEQEDLQIKQLREETATLQEQLNKLTDQIKKMNRTQFKSSMNIEEKITSLLSIQTKQHDVTEYYKQQQNSFIEQQMKLQDEFDHVLSGIKEGDQTWITLLHQWSQSIQMILEKVGVFEIHMVGQTFNPEIAESVQVVKKDTLQSPPEVPYQIVAVINRGYMFKDGQIIRKAKVITVEEE